MKKVLLLILLTMLLLSSTFVPVRAEQGLQIQNNSADIDFPAAVTFRLLAANHTAISDIRFRYRIEMLQFANAFNEAFIKFTPSQKVDVSWKMDMLKTGGLPPGAVIEYWWLITDVTGTSQTTPVETVIYNDNRYQWQSLAEDRISIYYYNGDPVFAAELMKVAQDALTRLADYTGVRLEKPVRIYVYNSGDDLRSAMIYPQEWTGGVAFTRFGVVALSVIPGDTEWAKQVIPHELTHQVVNQMIYNPYNDLPRWLDEGLAMFIEGKMAEEYQLYLEMAYATDSLISLRSLCSPFSAYREEAAISYSQSHSVVDFLISEFGRDKMLELLKTFKQGSGYDEALIKVYGFDIDELEALWIQKMEAERKVGTGIPAPAS